MPKSFVELQAELEAVADILVKFSEKTRLKRNRHPCSYHKKHHKKCSLRCTRRIKKKSFACNYHTKRHEKCIPQCVLR